MPTALRHEPSMSSRPASSDARLRIVNRTICRRRVCRRRFSSEADTERRYTARARPEAKPRRVTGTDGGGATVSADLGPRHRPPPLGAVQSVGQSCPHSYWASRTGSSTGLLVTLTRCADSLGSIVCLKTPAANARPARLRHRATASAHSLLEILVERDGVLSEWQRGSSAVTPEGHPCST